jgi:hypothetical protein
MTDSLLRSWGGRVLSKMRSMSSDLVLTTMLIFLSFDLELPTECDDEFWVPSGTGRAFEQPKHRPSYTSFFIWNLRLHNIVAVALRTIVSALYSSVCHILILDPTQYSLKKSKVALGFVGMEWEQKTVAELDTALEQWLQSIPEHCGST